MKAHRSESRVHRCLRQGYTWACERLYHELAWGYDLVSIGISVGGWDAWRRLALAEVRRSGLPVDAPLLEVGFGTGALLSAARSMLLPVVGLELSPEMHAVAAERLAVSSFDTPRVQATTAAMPFPDSHFGAVLSTFPSAYILDNATLNECARVLYDGGWLIVAGLSVTPLLAGHRLRLPLLYGELSSPDKARIVAAVELAGFKATFTMRSAGSAEIGMLFGHKQR